MLGNHVLPWRQTCQQISRLTSARRAPLQQFKRCMGIAFLASLPTCSINFGVKDERPALPCRDDVLVENGAAALRSHFSPLKMRTPTAAGGLLPTYKTSTVTRTLSHQLPLWFCPTEDKNLSTSVLYASYGSIFG